MNVLDAAAVVLQDAGGSLHYREIAKRLLDRELWKTSGRTPWHTVIARLSADIKDRGAASRFTRTSPGCFSLNPNRIEQPVHDAPPETEKLERNEDSGVLSFADAAEQILLQSQESQPLHYGLITERALERALIRTEGRTPSATMYSTILAEIRRRDAKGEAPRFVKHGRGIFGLASWLPVSLAARIEENNQEVRHSLLNDARAVSPDAFERLVGELLAAMGFEDVEVTRVSSDGGIDVRGTLVVGETVRIRMAVQAKRWKGNVQAPVVQQVRGSLGAHEQGLIITTSDFSRGAQDEAVRHDAAPVALMNGEQLAAMLAKHEIGARVEKYDLLTRDPLGE